MEIGQGLEDSDQRQDALQDTVPDMLFRDMPIPGQGASIGAGAADGEGAVDEGADGATDIMRPVCLGPGLALPHGEGTGRIPLRPRLRSEGSRSSKR